MKPHSSHREVLASISRLCLFVSISGISSGFALTMINNQSEDNRNRVLTNFCSLTLGAGGLILLLCWLLTKAVLAEHPTVRFNLTPSTRRKTSNTIHKRELSPESQKRLSFTYQ